MGFTTGFTGGVTLTLGLAYLTVQTHQRNRETQAAILRQQTYLLSGSLSPHPPTFPPSRAEIAALERANLIDSAKDRWNAEIESTVRWVQEKDWVEFREDVEHALVRLWNRASGGQVEDAGRQLKREIRDDAKGVAAAAKEAYADAKVKTEEKAKEAKGGLFSAIGFGVQKAKEVIQGTGELEGGVAVNAGDPVQKALKERFEKPSGDAVTKSVEEVLAERYLPVEAKDKTKLRAL